MKRDRVVTSLQGHLACVLPSVSQILKSGGANRASKEIRQRVVAYYFSHPVIKGGLGRTETANRVYEEMVKRGVLTRDELLEIADQLHSRDSRNGRTAFELAKQSRAAGNREEALRWSQTAVDELPPKTFAFRRVDFTLYAAEDHLALGGKTAAKVLLSELEASPTNPAQQARYDRVMAAAQ
ncbi:MAG: hypothetical protein AAF236_16090 [Verrucomicrobiota bacterium]